jgi:hypothetical protein
MYVLKRILILVFVLLFKSAQDVSAQVFLYANTIAQIDESVTKINARKSKQTDGIAISDTTNAMDYYYQPRVFGTFFRSHLERISVLYEESSGARWDMHYYFAHDTLIFIEINCFRVAAFGGPTWYELTYKGEFWWAENICISRRTTIIPPRSEDQFQFVDAELIDLAYCYADELIKSYHLR